MESSDAEDRVPLESKKSFRDGKHWVVETWGGERTTSDRVVVAHPNRAGMWSMLLLGRELSGAKPGVYSMHGVLPTGGDPAYHELPLTVHIEPPGPHEMRGVATTAQLIQIKAETGWVFSMVVSEGALLELWSNDYPTIFAACETEEECSQNLGKGLSDQNLALGPMDAMRVIYNVISGQLDVSALDAVVDWEACSADFERRWNEKPDPETLAAAIKEGFSDVSELDPELIESKLMMLEVTVDGNHALVRVPDQEVGFRLKKVENRWVVVGFPS